MCVGTTGQLTSVSGSCGGSSGVTSVFAGNAGLIVTPAFGSVGIYLVGANKTITYTSCTTITGGVPTGCSNVTESFIDGLAQ